MRDDARRCATMRHAGLVLQEMAIGLVSATAAILKNAQEVQFIKIYCNFIKRKRHLVKVQPKHSVIVSPRGLWDILDG